MKSNKGKNPKPSAVKQRIKDAIKAKQPIVCPNCDKPIYCVECSNIETHGWIWDVKQQHYEHVGFYREDSLPHCSNCGFEDSAFLEMGGLDEDVGSIGLRF